MQKALRKQKQLTVLKAFHPNVYFENGKTAPHTHNNILIVE